MTNSTTYSIESADGTAVGQGIQDRDSAVREAQNTADRTGKTFYVVAEGKRDGLGALTITVEPSEVR